jgi:predicted metalloprotease with PDZ domain
VKRWLVIFPVVLAFVSCGQSEREAGRPVADEPVPDGPDLPRQAETAPGAVDVVPEFRLRLDPGAHLLDASIELDVTRTQSIHLLFRADWDGYPGLETRLKKLEAWGPSGAIPVAMDAGEIGAGHHVIEVETPERVTISYQLVLAPPDESLLYHRASQLGSDGGHLLGGDMLPRVWIGRPRRGPQPARIWFTGLPSNWRVASVEERAGTGYEISDILYSVFVVGPLRTQRSNVSRHSLTTAIYGRWPVDDRRVFNATEQISGSLYRIADNGWAAGDYVLGAGRVPGSVPGLSAGGQVIGASGIVLVGGAGPAEIEFQQWMYTTAHELTHWYIPIGFSFANDPPKWFAEGFTDYLALKILLAGGLIEPQAFLDEVTARLTRYRNSSLYGNRSIVDAEKDFWEDETFRYIYDGGASAAFLLDLGFQDRGRALEQARKAARRNSPVDSHVLKNALAAIPENEWIDGWLATGDNPDWDARLGQYKLVWRNNTLVSLDDWATDALSTIRP